MTNLFKSLSLLALAIMFSMALPLTASAQDTNAPAATEKPSKKASKSEPKAATFNGKLGSVDKVNKTITLDDKARRVLQITSETIITRDGKPAILADGAMGDATRGTYKKTEDGKPSALTVNFGEAPKAPKPASKPKKAKPEMTNAPVATPLPAPAPAPMQTPVIAPAVPSTNAPAQ